MTPAGFISSPKAIFNGISHFNNGPVVGLLAPHVAFRIHIKRGKYFGNRCKSFFYQFVLRACNETIIHCPFVEYRIPV